MADRFFKQTATLDSVIYDAFEITPSSSELPVITRALYVGSYGNVTVMMSTYDNSNTIVTFSNINAGTMLPIRVKKVFANSSASALVGLF